MSELGKVCKHGQLYRQCELCEKESEIKELTHLAEVKYVLGQLHAIKQIREVMNEPGKLDEYEQSLIAELINLHGG